MTRQDVESAEEAMRSLFPATPLQLNDHLSARYGADIWLKREDLSPVRSYKIRGAFNFFRKVIAQGGTGKTFVCASAGNHAQGFAFVCRHFGVPGVVFMPVTTPQQKIDKTRMFGGEFITIRLFGDFFDQCYQAARDHVEQIDGVMVPPFDHADIIEGQATVAAEIMPSNCRKASVPDLVVLPVGGGGLAAGITGYLAGIGLPRIGFRLCRARRRAEPQAQHGDGRGGDARQGRQFRRWRSRRAYRRSEFRGAEGFSGRSGHADGGKRHLRDDHRYAECRGRRAGAGRRVVDHGARGDGSRERFAARPSLPSSPAAISISSACPTSRNGPCAMPG